MTEIKLVIYRTLHGNITRFSTVFENIIGEMYFIR